MKKAKPVPVTEADHDAADHADPTVSAVSPGDDPIHKPEQDRLGRRGFVDQLASVIQSVESLDTSCVFALVGPWGDGKSSVLNMVRGRLDEAAPEWDVVQFEPWMVTDLDSLVVEFFRALTEAVGVDEKKLRRKIGSVATQLVPAAKVLKMTGLDVSGVLDTVGTALTAVPSLAAQHDKLSDALEARARPILVVVDDLDRLHADELMLVFKLVRLVGRLPHVHYLLAYDEETVLDVLQSREITAQKPQRANAYLEKVVQYRFDLPPAHTSRCRDLAGERLNAVADAHSVDLDVDDSVRFVEFWSDQMWRGLSTVRSINRWATQIETTWPLVAGNVDFIDFAALTYLRLHEHGVYQLLRGRKTQLTDEEKPLTGDRPLDDQVQARWTGELADLHIPTEHVPAIVEYLARLFPHLGAAMRLNPRQRRPTADELADGRRIGSAEYFDRYFQMGVTEGIDIADPTVIDAIRDFQHGTVTSPAVDALTAAAADPESKAVWKFVRFVDREPVVDAGRLLELLAIVAAAAPAGSGKFGTDALVLVNRMTRLVAETTDLDVDAALRACALHDPDLDVVVSVTTGLQALRDREEPLARPEVVDEALATVSDLIADELATKVNVPLDPATFRTVQTWEQVTADHTRVQDWLWAVVDDPASPWDLATVMAFAVPLEQSNPPVIETRPGYRPTEDILGRLLGIAKLAERLGDPEPLPVITQDWDDNVSMGNRTAHARRDVYLAAQRAATATTSPDAPTPDPTPKPPAN